MTAVYFIIFIIALIVIFFTAGFGAIVVVPVFLVLNIISVFCCIVSINNHNEKIRNEVLSGVR